MHVTLTIDRPGTEPFDIRISASHPVPLSQLSAMLPAPLDDFPARPLFGDGNVLPVGARLGDPCLRNGSVLSTERSADRASSAASVVQLKVVAGPDCGQVIPLHRGSHVLGRGTDSDIALNDPNLSRRHVRLRISLQDLEVQDLESTNGTAVNGEPIGVVCRRIPLPSVISVGASQLVIEAVSEPLAVTIPDDTGLLRLHRPSRVADAPQSTVHSMPDAPAPAPRPRIQWLAALLPIAICALLTLTMRSTQMLALIALSPASLVASTMVDRRRWRRNQHTELAEFDRTRRAIQQAIDQSLRLEIAERRRKFADAASILRSATSYDCRLWERRPDDGAFLALRLGLADQPARTAVNRNGRTTSAGTMSNVPATVSLTERVLGVAGPDHCLDGLRRWLVGQALALHSPVDLGVILIADQNRGAHWRWLRWLPAHVPTIAISAEQRTQAVDRMLALMRYRRHRHPSNDQRWQGCWTLILIDPADLVTALPGLSEVLAHGPAVGLTAICFARDHRLLPTGCSATARLLDDTGTEALLSKPGCTGLSVTVDRVGPDWVDRMARSLACVRDADDVSVTGSEQTPQLSELLGLQAITAGEVQRQWRRPSALPSASLGVSGRRTFQVDLVRDGPHLLIAGTTGSGKSELLKVLIASLAVQHPPTDLTFVLIDYKGGAAFAECADLPHVAGLVTDLDPQLTHRALASLNAELRRRERAFAEVSAADYAEYRCSVRYAEHPLSRLVLVIDEFASLAEELPELLAGLLGIAQRGRSLGVHLVLATQRPAGVLSPDIKANVGLRIALRMSDAADSVDVVGTDAASRISRTAPGRGIARHADGELEEFQAACVSRPTRPDQPVVTELDDWNRPVAPMHDSDEPTELAVLKQAIAAAAAGLPRSKAPWLEPLPSVLPIEPCLGSPVVAFGRSDEPARQRQSQTVLDLTQGGSIGLIGGPRSGRTTALRTIIGTAVSQLAADRLHTYVIDCAGAGLRPLGQLPHCGALLETTEPLAVARLIVRLVVECRRRQQYLAELNALDFAEAFTAGRLPAILVAVDGWEGLSSLSDEMDGGRSAESLIQLLREGPSVGFSLLITGDRGTLGARIAPALGRKLLLPLTDRSDYAIAGLGSAAIPSRPIAGRAVTVEEGIEVQIGLLTDEVSTAAQWQALNDGYLDLPTMSLPSPTGPAIRISPLPVAVGAAALAERWHGPATEGHCLLGVGRDDASVIGCELFRPNSRFLIAGPDGSGKSCAAISIGRQGSASGLRIAVAATARSPLARWAAENQAAVLNPNRLIEGLSADLLIIDDAEQFTDSLAGDGLLAWIALTEAAVVATIRTAELLASFRGIGAELRRHRCGLLLQPSATDGEVFGIRLAQLPASAIPGRGVLVTPETRNAVAGYEPIQVAI